MRRSKLETCLIILEVLASHGLLKKTHVMRKANLNCIVMNNYFDFLIEQSAVEERRIEGNRIVYVITERGLYLIKCFKELNLVIPTGRIRSGIPPIISKNESNWNEHKKYCNSSQISPINY